MIKSDCVYRIVWRAFYHLSGGIAVEAIPPVPYALHLEKICATIYWKACRTMRSAFIAEGSASDAPLNQNTDGITVEVIPSIFVPLLSGGFSAGKSVEYPGTFRGTGKTCSRHAAPLCFEQ